MRTPGTDGAYAFLDYFRCPPEFAPFHVLGNWPTAEGFFRFGPALCFGRAATVPPQLEMERALSR